MQRNQVRFAVIGGACGMLGLALSAAMLFILDKPMVFPPRIDGSSPEAMQRSIDAMSDSLGTNDQALLAEAVLVITSNGMPLEDIGKDEWVDEDPTGNTARQRMHGKTFVELKRLATELSIARRLKPPAAHTSDN